MAQIKERLVKTNELVKNDEQFYGGLLAATAVKGADGFIRPINPNPGDEWYE